MIEHHLERIASALEAIAQALNPGFVVLKDGVEHVPVNSAQMTMTAPPLEWFNQEQRSNTAQTTWEWLGITPPPKRARDKMPQVAQDVTVTSHEDGRIAAGRARRGRPLKCGRCRREGRSRMHNHDRCKECLHEEWWDE